MEVLLETIYEDLTTGLYTETHIKFKFVTIYGQNFLLEHFNMFYCIKYSEMNLMFHKAYLLYIMERIVFIFCLQDPTK